MAAKAQIELLIRAQSKQLHKDLMLIQRTVNKRFAKMRTQVNATFAPIARYLGGAYIIRGIARSAKAWGDFEKALSDVQAKTDETTHSIISLREEVMRVAAATQYTPIETAESAGLLAMAGFNIDQVEDALESTLALASATRTSAANAADIMTNVATPLDMLDADKLKHVGDVLALLTASANVNIVQVGESMSYAAGTLNTLKLSLEEGAALIGAMGDAGIKGSRGGTAFRQVLVAMNRSWGAATKLSEDSTEKLTKQMQVLKKLGVELFDGEKKTRGFMEVWTDMVDAGATTADMFEFFGPRAGASLGAIVKRVERVKELTASLEKPDDAMRRMQETQLDNLAGDLKIMESNIQTLSLLFWGSGIGEVIRSWIQGLTDFFIASRDRSRGIGRFLAGVADLIASAWEKVKSFMWDLDVILGRIMGRHYSKVGNSILGAIMGGGLLIALRAIVSVLLLVRRIMIGIAILVGGWFFVAALAVGLVVGGILAFSNELKAVWAEIKHRSKFVMLIIENVIKYLVAEFKAAFLAIKIGFNHFIDIIKHNFTIFGDTVAAIWDDFMYDIKTAINWVIDRANDLIGILNSMSAIPGVDIAIDLIPKLDVSGYDPGPLADKLAKINARVAPGQRQEDVEQLDSLNRQAGWAKSGIDAEVSQLTHGFGTDFTDVNKKLSGQKSLFDEMVDGMGAGIASISNRIGAPGGGAPGEEGGDEVGGMDTRTYDKAPMPEKTGGLFDTQAEMDEDGNIISLGEQMGFAKGMFSSLMEASNIMTDGISENFTVTVGNVQKTIKEVFTKGGKDALAAAQQLFTRFAKLNKKAAKAMKLLMIGQAIRNTYTAVTAALSSVLPTWPNGAAAAAWALATGMMNVAEIRNSKAHSGITDIPKDGTWDLQKGERVLDRDLNQDLKDFLNTGDRSGQGQGNTIYLHPRGMYTGEDIFDAFGGEMGTVVKQAVVR